MEFDHIITDTTAQIQIGYKSGTNKILFIKTGQGGSIYGYENKYINLAQTISEKYGFSVFVSATTLDNKEVYDKEMQILDRIFHNKPYEIYYMGISKGGLIGCWYGTDNHRIKKMVSINAPLMINFHNKTLPSIKKYPRNKFTMIYGSLDPSARYLDFVTPYATVKTVTGADHQFRNHTEIFEAIAINLIID